MGSIPLVSTSKGILAVGGEGIIYNPPNNLVSDRNEILQLICPDGQEVSHCYWKDFPQKLNFGRGRHVVIPLPASYELCNN